MANVIIGELNGNNCILDPQTGYLEAKGGYSLSGFTAAKKTAFIRLGREGMWPNVMEICKKVGISRATFSNHLLIDPLFAQHVQELKDTLCDNVEADMAGYAKEKANYLDRITILRAHRPEVYDPAKKVIMQHSRNQQDEDATSRRLAETRNFVDAELVKPEQLPPAPPATPAD